MVKPAYYWDTCVFIAHLNEERGQHGQLVDHIGQFLEEAHRGECAIYCSSVTIAEIPESALLRKSHFAAFLRDFQGAVVPIDPGPSIMRIASHLRSQPYEKQGSARTLSTPDAIHLATAIALQDFYGVEVSRFHTFDRGKRRGEDGGKGLPLIGYQEWCQGCLADDYVGKVVAMHREQPAHPSPKLAM